MNKPYIVAEMSGNHLGSLERALAIVEAAAYAGADAVKLQTWVLDTMVLRRGHMWKGKDLFDLYREAYLPWQFHRPIFDHCKARGIECFSAPFDKQSVDFLEKLDCPRYKIASFELVDLDLIAYVARLGKPMILSTGMATPPEIYKAILAACPSYHTNHLTLLKCTSAYPADASDANLKSMEQYVGINCGISDHTEGIGVAVAAAALGATYIEKHLTLSRADGGPDASFSMEPHEFEQMVTECRRAAAAVGIVKFGPTEGDCVSLRRSLHYAKDFAVGHVIKPGDIITARPADGLPPHMLNQLIGQELACAVTNGDPVGGDFEAESPC